MANLERFKESNWTSLKRTKLKRRRVLSFKLHVIDINNINTWIKTHASTSLLYNWMKCDMMPVQTEVALKIFRYVFGLMPDLKGT